MEPITNILVSSLLGLSMIAGVLSIDCYRCVYDPSQANGISIFSAASVGFKTNDPSCGSYFKPSSAVSASCNILTQGCLTIKYTTQAGIAYSRGCTVLCSNRTQTVSAGGKKYEGHYNCCKTSLCNRSSAGRMEPQGLIVYSALVFISYMMMRVWKYSTA